MNSNTTSDVDDEPTTVEAASSAGVPDALFEIAIAGVTDTSLEVNTCGDQVPDRAHLPEQNDGVSDERDRGGVPDVHAQRPVQFALTPHWGKSMNSIARFPNET